MTFEQVLSLAGGSILVVVLVWFLWSLREKRAELGEYRSAKYFLDSQIRALTAENTSLHMQIRMLMEFMELDKRVTDLDERTQNDLNAVANSGLCHCSGCVCVGTC